MPGAPAESRARSRRRGRLVGVATLLGGLALSGCGLSLGSERASGTPTPSASASSTGSPDASVSPSESPSPASPSPTPSPTYAPAATLPGGLTTIMPGHRVVAYYGDGSTDVLGTLGVGTPAQALDRLQRQAAAYVRPGQPVIPAVELITVMADRRPGPDGNFSHQLPLTTVDFWLAQARAHHMLLVLDIQPGLSPFIEYVRQYERYLLQPDVSLALDPEWRVQPGQVPGRVIGKVSVGEINQVSQYLSDLVVANDLPQKLLLVHEFRTWQIQPKPAAVQHRPGIAFVWHVDGFGGQAAKLRTYQALALPPPAIMGFKLFYKQDTNLMTPAQVLALNPPPSYISYQ